MALALFLEIRLAFWVALGIAISGAGALSAMLVTGVSVNTISLFAFVLAIGIVVDDAIVVAESVHRERRSWRRRGGGPSTGSRGAGPKTRRRC